MAAKTLLIQHKLLEDDEMDLTSLTMALIKLQGTYAKKITVVH
jgi:hypothetical protein